MTQTPASGPLELATMPPISVARTSTVCCARKPVEHTKVIERKANADKRASALVKYNMDRLPGTPARRRVFIECKFNKGAGQRPAESGCKIFQPAKPPPSRKACSSGVL